MKKRILSLVLAMAMCFALGINAFAVEPQEINWAEEEYRFDMTIDEKIAWMDAHGIEKQHYVAEQVARSNSYLTSNHVTYTGPTYIDEPDTPYLNVAYIQSRVRYYTDGEEVTDWEDYSHTATILSNYRIPGLSMSEAAELDIVSYSPAYGIMRVNYGATFRTTHGVYLADQIYYLYPDGEYDIQEYFSMVSDNPSIETR